MMEGGDITDRNGKGGTSIYPGGIFEDENYNIKHSKRGILSMANYGPKTNGSRFMVLMNDQHWMDDKYVVFGEVIEGMDVIDELEKRFATASGSPKRGIIWVSECGEIKDTPALESGKTEEPEII